jgi:hypothetical protein
MPEFPTIPVNIDPQLLAKLRERHPSKTDQQLLEYAAHLQLLHEDQQHAREHHARLTHNAQARATKPAPPEP